MGAWPIDAPQLPASSLLEHGVYPNIHNSLMQIRLVGAGPVINQFAQHRSPVRQSKPFRQRLQLGAVFLVEPKGNYFRVHVAFYHLVC